jgi:predicted dehydrogenase
LQREQVFSSMKFLIVGFGSIGRRHFRNLVSLGEEDILFLLSYTSSLPDDEIAKFPVYTKLNDALAQKPDAVIIATPSSMHLDVAIPAAEKGFSILMEKPLSNNLDRVANLVDAVRRSNSKVLMGYQFRFHPNLLHIHHLITQNEIGRILSARAQWGEYLPDWHPWEDYRKSYSANEELGGGVILTLCHPFDYLRWLLSDIEAVWAFSGTLGDLGIAVEDTAEIGLRFTNGAYGSINLSYNQQPTTHKLEIIGTSGTIRWDNSTGSAELYKFDTGRWEVMNLPDGYERNDLFLSQMQHFIKVVRREESPACTLADGVKSLEVALAAKQSANLGQMVLL